MGGCFEGRRKRDKGEERARVGESERAQILSAEVIRHRGGNVSRIEGGQEKGTHRPVQGQKIYGFVLWAAKEVGDREKRLHPIFFGAPGEFRHCPSYSRLTDSSLQVHELPVLESPNDPLVQCYDTKLLTRLLEIRPSWHLQLYSSCHNAKNWQLQEYAFSIQPCESNSTSRRSLPRYSVSSDPSQGSLYVCQS